jgi:hypothetical protein
MAHGAHTLQFGCRIQRRRGHRIQVLDIGECLVRAGACRSGVDQRANGHFPRTLQSLY